jgi:tape measure domain-containing protein
VEIASIWLDARVNLNSVIRDLQQLNTKQFSVDVGVDDRALTNLNKHLDKKVSHLKQVQSYFNSNPLRVRVDDRDLTGLNKKLDAASKGKRTINIGVNASQQDLDKLGETITKSVSAALKKSLSSQIGSAITSAVGGSLNLTIGSVFRGIFEGLGREASRDLSKGIAQGLESAVSGTVGSSGLLGETIAKAISGGITKKLGSETKKELEQLFKDLLGEQDIITASRASRYQRGVQKRKDTQSAREQTNIERREAIRDYRTQSEALSNNLFATEEVRQAYAKGSELRNKLQNQLSAVIGNDAETKRLTTVIDEVSRALNALSEEELGLIKQEAQLKESVEQARERVRKARANADTIAPKTLPNAYREAVVQVFGEELPEHKLPKMVLADNEMRRQNARAAYGAESNAIMMRKDLYDAIAKAKSITDLTEKQRYALFEELQHAKDLGTGSLKGIAANRRGEILGTPVQGSPQELKAIAKELSAYTAEEQLIERNAKLKARRDVQASIDKELRSQSEQRLTNLAGSGGIKFDNLVQKQFDRIKVLLKGVMESAEKSGVSITNEIAPYVARFQSLKQEVTASSDNLAAIPQLSAAELDQLSAKISQDLKSLNDFIAETSSYIKDFVAKTSQQEIQIPVDKNPEAELVSADSTVQAVARQSALINKESVVKQAQQSIQESKKAQQEISKSQKVEHGLGYAKELATKFRKAHEDLKQAIKRGDKEIAAGLAKIIQENAIEANKEIAAITKDLGDEAKMGTTLGSQLANAKSQVSHASKASKRAIAKYKIPSVVEIEETRKQLSGDGEIEQLRKQRLDFDFLKNNSYINNILKNAEAASDRFDSAYKRFGKQLDKRFESAANNVNSFFEEVNAGGKESTGIIESLAGAAKGMAARFGALLIITTVVGALNQFKDASIETAIAFETLERRVTFASGSFSEGAKNLQFLRKQAKDLRVDLRQTLEGGAGFLSATRDTALEGDPSRQILGAVNQASAVYGMSGEQQNRALLALQQMAGKSVISQEELRQQLGEAIPGAANIAARAMGVTVQEMNKMIESGQVLAEDFLPKFAQQLSAESQSGLTSALDSSQSSLNRFNNSVTELQESTGSALLPLRNFSLNALSTGLEAIVSLAPAIINFLKFLTLWLTKPVWMPALESLKAFKPSLMNLGDVGGAAFANIVKSGRQLISIMGPFLAQFAGFTVAIAAVTALKDAFSDLGGEFRKSADAARQATSDIQKAIGQSSGDIDQQVFEKNARNRASRSLIAQPAVDYVLGALGGRNRTKELKEAKDQVKAINEEMIATNKQLELSRSQEAASKIEQVKSIDKQLEEIRIRRSATIRLNPQDTQSLRQLKQQESALLQVRQTTVEPVAKIQKELNARADFLQKAIDRIEQIRATDDTRTQAEDQAYQNQVDNLKKSLEEVKQAQDEFNKSLGESATAFTQMQKGIKSVADRLADMSDRATFSTNKAKTAIAQGILSGQITPGQERSAQQQVEIAALKQQLQAQIAAFLETRSLLLTDENQARMRDFGVNFSTGRARLATLAEQESSNPKNKYLFEQLGGLQERKLQISDLQSQYAQARANVRKQLVDLTKQVADFYRGIERQAKEQAIETKKLSNQIGASSAQNKLRNALLDGYDTITTQFVDAIIQEIDQQKAISDRAIDTQSQLLQNQFSLQDTLRQGVELSRSLPGQIPPIPVKVDLSSIHDDANVQALNEELQQSIFTTEELNNSLYNAEDIINSSVDLVDDLNKGFDQTTQNTVNTFNELNNVTLGLTQSKDLVGEINDLSQGWNNTLNQSQSQAEGIQGIFQGIIDWILKLVSETQNWLNLLSSGIHTITNPTGVLGGIGVQLIGYPVSAGQTALSFGQGILDKASNLPGFAQLRGLFGIEQGQSQSGVASPLANATLEQLIAYNPSAQQGFYGVRDGGKRRHSKVDFDSRVNAGQGAIVQAVVQGMATWRQISGNSAGIDINTADSQGRNITVVYNHLKLDEVQKLFGGRQSIPVSAGQKIGSVTHDALSSGPHLDFGIKINGQYVDPQAFIKNVLLPLQKSGGTFSGSHSTATQQPRYNNPVPKLPPPDQRLTYPAGYIPPTPIASTTSTAPTGNISNLTRFMHIIGWGESNLQNKGPNSVGATGYFQFIPSTRRLAMQRTGLDPWSSNIQSSAEAAAAWLKKAHPKAWQALQKGDFQSAYQLLRNEWTSLPGAAESNWGKNSTFSLQRLKQFESGNFTPKFALGGSAIAQSQQQQTLSPQSLQSQVANANQVVQSISSQKTVQIQQQSQLDIERQQKELIRTHERNLEQYRRNQRELEDQRRAGRREVTDAAFSADSNPSPSDQFTKRINDINRQYEDYIRERGRQKELLERDLKVAEDALASGGLQPEQEALIQKQVEFNKKGIKELSSEIERLTKLRSQASESAKKLFDREEQQRRRQAGFAQERVEIEVLQGKLQILQEIQKLNPYDEKVRTIPALQEQISLKQNDLQLDQDLFQLEQELYSHSIVQEEYDKRAEAIKKANIQRQNEIALTRQQAEEQQRLLELQRNLELRGQLNEGRSQNLQIQQELAQRNFSRSPSLDTSALKAIQEENINAQIEAQRIAYEKQMLELREQLRKSPEIANQTKGLMLNAAFLNQSRLAQFNNSKQDLDGQLRSQQIQKQLDRLSLEEVINAPSINLQKMRAQRIQDTGGNIFQANALNRNAAIQEEEIRYKQEILSLEKQINEARLAGQNIDDSQVKEMYASLEKIHGINLENVNRQFKTFGATLNEVAQGAVSGLAQSLTDLILKGGSLSDVLDNLANTVLSGVLNAGLNSVFGSLFGGLFYDGGLVPNYAGGGIHRAMAKEKSMSGREPMLAVVHRGEMLIPAKRMKELNAIGLGEKQLLGYADGGIVGWEKNENISAMQSMSKSAVSDRTSGTTQVNVSYQVERINERNYVDEETFRQGMKKAAEAGANKGYARMSRDINKSTSFRRNAGF